MGHGVTIKTVKESGVTEMLVRLTCVSALSGSVVMEG